MFDFTMMVFLILALTGSLIYNIVLAYQLDKLTERVEYLEFLEIINYDDDE